jgi:hypothetical protein
MRRNFNVKPEDILTFDENKGFSNNNWSFSDNSIGIGHYQ